MLEDLSKCRCSECPFAVDGKPGIDREVPGVPARKTSKLTVIGEYPRFNDESKEDAWSGMQGVFVREALRGVLPVSEVTHVNAVRCWKLHPTENEIRKAANACVPRLNLPEGPKLALGQHALYTARGHREWKLWSGAKVGDTYVSHSVMQMFAQPHNRTALKAHLKHALKPVAPKPNAVIEDGPEMQKTLERLIGEEIAVDIETAGTNPFVSPIICIGVGTADLVASVPWHIGSDVKVRASPKTQELLRRVLADAKCLIAHNGSHDFAALESRGFTLAAQRFDTFIAHGIVHPELPHRLQYVAGTEFSCRAWKGEFLDSGDPDAKGLEKFLDRPLEELMLYNTEDVAFTARVAPLLRAKLNAAEFDAWAHYNFRDELNAVLTRMSNAGMPFDEAAREELDVWVNFDAVRYREKFEAFAGGIDAGVDGGTAAVKTFFFDTLKAPIISTTDAGKPSLSKDVLKRYLQEQKDTPIAEAARLLLKLKLYGKLHGSFTKKGALEVWNGKVQASFNVIGTVSGRLSCSGPNLMQMPAVGRKMFTAPEGYVFVEADWSQAEPRVTADLSEDPLLLGVYQNDRDLYLTIGEQVFELPYDSEALLKKRAICKMLWLSVAYSVGAQTMMEQLASRGVYVSLPVASTFLTKLQRGFPRLTAWQKELVRKAEIDGFVEEPYSGWRRYFYSKRDVEVPKVRNWPFQAGCAALMGKSMIALAEDVRGTQAKIVCQVHDSLTLLVPQDEAGHWKQTLEQQMYHKLNYIELVAEAQISRGWYDVKG